MCKRFVRMMPGQPGEQLNKGMIGFDGDYLPKRSGSRMQSHLVNALCKPIGADSKRTDFALAA